MAYFYQPMDILNGGGNNDGSDDDGEDYVVKATGIDVI